MLYIFIFILGSIIGSFLNVVILRYKTGRGLGGRSACMICSRKLGGLDLVPIFSYLFLRGRCRGCNTKISTQYFLVELFTALSFVALAYHYSYLISQGDFLGFGIIFSFYAIIFSLFIVVFAYDMRHMIIPDSFVYTISFLALIPHVIGLVSLGVTKYSVLNILAGPIFFIFIGLLWFFSQGRAIGFGDAKLVLAMGLVLGFSKGLVSVVLGFWIGAVVGVFLLFWSKYFKNWKYKLKSEIPFGPFLIIGFALSFFLGLDLVWMSSLFV
jgi:leader peptidase (prepilin peptidase)/N-methyltransferase